MKQYLLKKFIIAIFLLLTAQTYAQDSDTIEIKRNSDGKVAFARFKVNNASIRSMKNHVQFLQSILQMQPTDSLANIKSDTDEVGMIHKRFQQYYKSIKVENATYLIHGKENSIETINGEFAVVNISSVKSLKPKPKH